MAYGTPADPVSGTVITVAYAVANLLDPIRWLRLMTGNADPPGSAYIAVSNSTTGVTWSKITADAILDGAILTSKISDGQVTGPKIAPNTITEDRIVVSGITGNGPTSAIGANTIHGNRLMTNTVPASALVPTAVTDQLGYHPVSRAGDSSITGGLGMVVSPGTGQPLVGLTIQNASGGASSALIKLVASGLGVFIGAISGTSAFAVLANDGVTILFRINASGQLEVGGQTVWNRGNDGQGSGLDADLLDGRETGIGNGNIAFYNANGRVVAAGYADAAGNASTAGDASTLGTRSLGGAPGNIPFYDASGRVAAASFADAAGNASTLGTLTGAQYLSRANHNGTQLASTISDLAAAVGAMSAGSVQGYHASTTPAPNSAVCSDSSGTLNGWGIVPSHVIAAWAGDGTANPPASTIPVGWTRYAAANGRLLVGDGTTFSQAFAVGTSYGTSWSHAHAATGLGATSTFSGTGGTTGDGSSATNQANVTTPATTFSLNNHTHAFTPAGTVATTLSGNVAGTTWLPAMYSVIWIQKS